MTESHVSRPAEEVPDAAELLNRARRGDFTIHMPNVCIGEARQAIMTKCQPRKEADAIRRFLSWMALVTAASSFVTSPAGSDGPGFIEQPIHGGKRTFGNIAWPGRVDAAGGCHVDAR